MELNSKPWPDQRLDFLAKKAHEKRLNWLVKTAEQSIVAEQRGIARRAIKSIELVMIANRKVPGKFRFTLTTGEPLQPGIYEAKITDFKWSDE